MADVEIKPGDKAPVGFAYALFPPNLMTTITERVPYWVDRDADGIFDMARYGLKSEIPLLKSRGWTVEIIPCGTYDEWVELVCRNDPLMRPSLLKDRPVKWRD